MNNVHPETGVPYGVISGNSVPNLVEEITTQGEDLSFLAYKQELQDKLKSAIANALEDYCRDSEDMADHLDYDDMLESLMDAGLNDCTCDEPEYSYEEKTEHGKIKYQLGWLGGAILIWVTESPWIVPCAQCSPCVPNAGDLNNPRKNGIMAYCVKPEDLPEDWDGPQPTLSCQVE